MAARSIASLTVSFGLVSIPVKLYSATETSAAEPTTNATCRGAARYVVDFVDADARLRRFARLTWGSDEFLVPTVLLNSPLAASVRNNNLRYIDWSAGGANPKVMTHDDLPALDGLRGLAVVGHQPLLKPGEQFEYSSGTPLDTPQGSMKGEYFCVAEDGHRFEAPIPEFVLSLPRTLH